MSGMVCPRCHQPLSWNGADDKSTIPGWICRSGCRLMVVDTDLVSAYFQAYKTTVHGGIVNVSQKTISAGAPVGSKEGTARPSVAEPVHDPERVAGRSKR